MKQRGRPIRGALAGLFFGLFVSLDLVIFGVFALDADVLALFPVVGLVGGVLLGLAAPLRRRRGPVEAGAAPAPDERQREPELGSRFAAASWAGPNNDRTDDSD